MKIDPVLFEVLNNALRSVSEEMCHVIHRTSHTTHIKETNDLAAAIFTPSGELFSYPRTMGVTVFLGLHLGEAIRRAGALKPGDVMLTNDPYSTAALVTHLPDIHLYMPVFQGQEIVCFVWAFIHSTDVGGNVPTSLSPTNSEIFQEGIRIPPTKLHDGGELNQQLVDIYFANVRVPDQNWGDIKGMLAALKTGERRILALVEKYGLETIQAMQTSLLDYAEAKARQIVSRIPDGRYEFVDYLEDDFVSKVPIRLSLQMTVAGDAIHLDFTGTDPQVAAAFNIPTAGRNHPWICNALIMLFTTHDRSIPLNAGMLRPISVLAPEGSVLNPVFPAACGVRHTTGFRVFDVIIGALSKAVPDLVPAAGAGQGTMPSIAIHDKRTGKRKVAVLEPIIGGSGGRPHGDGVDATDTQFSFFGNVPVELQESELPVIIWSYRIVCDSGGPGKFRGGLAISMDFQVLAPNALLVVRGMERFRFAPWGVRGGRPGSLGQTILNPGTQSEQFLGKLTQRVIGPRDVLRFTSPSGGGYGNPWERDVDRVVRDVRSGRVSRESAETHYGVMINSEGVVDDIATERRRSTFRQTANAAPHSFCSTRLAYEDKWTPSGIAGLRNVLDSLPIHLRHSVKTEIIERAIASLSAGKQLDAEKVAATWDEIRAETYQGI